MRFGSWIKRAESERSRRKKKHWSSSAARQRRDHSRIGYLQCERKKTVCVISFTPGNRAQKSFAASFAAELTVLAAGLTRLTDGFSLREMETCGKAVLTTPK